jgi:multicomponent Na+:H+ antiporter subunit G
MTQTILDAATLLLSLAGAAFFIAGTVGLLRFPDTYMRLHAITKADNLGLGFIVFSLALQSENPFVIAKLMLIWLLAMLVGSNACFMIGRWAMRHAKKEGGEDDGL